MLSLSKVEAKALGVQVERERALLIVCASLASASALSVTGIIGWIGLIVPHMIRFILGPNARLVIPASLCFGGAFLLATDIFARSMFWYEIPVGIITTLGGVPLFVYLLRRGKQTWA